MAKVLLVNPSKWGRGITPIWIAAHSAALKEAGHEVALFDATFYKEWCVDENRFNTQNRQYRPTNYHEYVKFNEEDIFQDFQRKVDAFQPDLIFGSAISSHIHGEGEYVNIQYSNELLSQIKTDALKVAAGLQPTAIPNQLFELFPQFDLFIRGESDLLICEVAAHHNNQQKLYDLPGLVYRKNERVCINPPQKIISNLDVIPHYDYSVFEKQIFWRSYDGKVMKAVDYELSRGCIFACTYCVETVIQKYYGFEEVSEASGAIRNPKAYLRHKSAKRIYEELHSLQSKHGINLIRCQDTNFLTINRAMLNELATLMQKNPLQIKLYVETRVDRMNEGDGDLLKKLNVVGVGTGVELSSESFRKDQLRRYARQDKLFTSIQDLKRKGIQVTTYNIIGLPSETEEQIIETINFNRQLEPNHVTVAFYSPYQGTPEALKAKEKDYFDLYEFSVDGQLRTLSKASLVSREVLQFYKKYFVTFVKEGLDQLQALKQKEGIQPRKKAA